MENNKESTQNHVRESFSSPEQLNDYLKVTNPGVWVALAGVVIFFVGVLVWSVFGHLSMKETFEGRALDGVVTLHCTHDQARNLEVGQTGDILGDEGRILSVTEVDKKGRTEVKISTTLPDGEYPVELVIETIRPLSFLFA